jgi:hypothetical protein
MIGSLLRVSFNYTSIRGAEMQETRQLRRAKLTHEVGRKRELLHTMKFAVDKAPFKMKERLANGIQEVEEELRKMEKELHELNVRQIREELSSG